MEFRNAAPACLAACVVLSGCGDDKPPPFELAPTEATVAKALTDNFAQAREKTEPNVACTEDFSLQSVSVVEDPEVYYTSGPHYVVDVHAVYTATRLKPSARGGAEVLDCFGANARAHQDWSVGDTQEVHFDNGLYYRDGGWALTITDRPTRLPNAAPHPFKRGTNGHPGV